MPCEAVAHTAQVLTEKGPSAIIYEGLELEESQQEIILLSCSLLNHLS